MSDVLPHLVSVITQQLFNLVIDPLCFSVPIGQEQSTEDKIVVILKVAEYAVLHCDIYSKSNQSIGSIEHELQNKRPLNFPFAFF